MEIPFLQIEYYEGGKPIVLNHNSKMDEAILDIETDYWSWE